MKSLIAAAIAVLFLPGCASAVSSTIYLQHPDTKQTVQCTAKFWSTWDVSATTDSCARAYEKSGYRRIQGF